MTDIGDRLAAFTTSEYQGLGFQEREMPCPSCRKQTSIRIVYFVDLEFCPAYADAVRTEWVERNDCRHCSATFRTRSPVIVECRAQNLLVFATHGGDYGSVEQGFRQWLGFVRTVVPREVYARLQTQPYTFVHGWTGLAVLFDVFKGKPPVASAPPYPHEVDDDGAAVELLDGYAFGPLQFWQPAHRAIQPAAHLILGITSWLEEEIGRQCLILGDRAAAREHLSRAQTLYHSWITPTASFLDATPTRRPEGTHGVNAPSADGAVLLRRPVTSIRHTVTALWPHTADYGLWYFPKMCAASYAYTLDAVLRVNGTLVGAILSALGTPKFSAFRTQMVAVGFDTMLEQTLEIVAGGEDDLLRLFAEGVREGARDRAYRASAAAKEVIADWPGLANLFDNCGFLA